MLDIERLLDELDLVDLAHQAGAKLRQGGQQWRGPCPLHHGDNPTGFAVMPGRNDPARLHWWCHTCGAGDALGFIMRWRSLEFIDAAKWAADYLRIPLSDLGLTPAAIAEHSERQARRDVLDLAARYYQHQFRKRPHAIEYARGRSFTPRTMIRFGFSDGGPGLQAYLAVANADMTLAHKIGLLRADGRDFTANHDGQKAAPTGWLIYVHWSAGRVDYLSARALEPVDPKDKSRNLPGRRQVYRAEARGDSNIVIVEGQADAETLRQLGVSGWALCGAALDESVIRTLRRRRVIYLALDDDAHRAGDEDAIAERANETVKHLLKIGDQIGPLTMIPPELPTGVKDCNQWLQDEPLLTGRNVRAWLSTSRPWMAVRIELAKLAGPIEQAEHIPGIAHLLALLPQAVQGKWYRDAGKALGMTKAEIQNANGRAPNGDYLAAEVKEGCLTLYGQPLVNAALTITRQQTVNDGTNPPQIRYTIAGRLASGQPLRELQVAAADFEGLGWMSEYGARLIKLCSRGNTWQIARAIQEISTHSESELQEENVYAHTGWATINGQRAYLTEAGMLTAAGLDATIKIDLGENALHYALQEPPTGDELRRVGRASLDFLRIAPARVTAPLWAAMYAAPMSTEVKDFKRLDAVLWVYGSTGSGKSTITHLALAHFGRYFVEGRNYQAQIGWNATPFAIETAMFTAKDAPLVVDDYAPQFMASMSERDKLRKTANETIRALGNRLSRAKGVWTNGDGKVKARHNPRCLLISTAENPIEGQSLVNRMIYVPVEKGDVLRPDGNPQLNAGQGHASAGVYSQAMSAFLRWLIGNWAGASQRFLSTVENTAREARVRLPAGFDRMPDYAGVLDAAQELALQAWVQMGAIGAKEADELAEENHEAILGVVSRQAGRSAEQSPARMFLQTVESLLDRRLAYLDPRKGESTQRPNDRSVRIGWYDPDDHGAVWLDTQVALNAVMAFYREGGVTFDTSRDALNRLMVQADMLRAVGENGRTEVSKWMGVSHTQRALEVDTKKAKELFEVDLHYPRGAFGLDEPDEDQPPFDPGLL